MAPAKKGKEKKGKGKGKGKGKKKAGKKSTTRPSAYYDKPKTPLWSGTYEFEGKTGDSAKDAFLQRSKDIRDALRFEKENSLVCFHVRQIGVSAHDFYVTVAKSCNLERLQMEISSRQHLGSVLPADVAICKPSYQPPPSDEFAFGQARQAKVPSGGNSKKKTDGSAELGGGDEDDAISESANAEDDPSEPQYFTDASLSLIHCFPEVQGYKGGSQYFSYNPAIHSMALPPAAGPVPPPLSVLQQNQIYLMNRLNNKASGSQGSLTNLPGKKDKSPSTFSSTHSIHADEHTLTKEKTKGKKKSTKKLSTTKKVEPPPKPEPKLTQFIPPAPIDVYYDILPYIEPPDAKLDASGPPQHHSANTFRGTSAISASRSMSVTQPFTKSRQSSSRVDTSCPLLMSEPSLNAPAHLYGLSLKSKRPQTAPPLGLFSRKPEEAAVRATQSAGTTRRNLVGNTFLRKIKPSRPSSSSHGEPKLPLLPSILPGSTADQASWDQRWMHSWKDMGGEYEWDQIIKKSIPSDAGDDSMWESEDSDIEADEPDWVWRMKEWVPSAQSIQKRTEARKKIDAARYEAPDDKKGKKGKKGDKKKGKAGGKGKKK
ncbi:hypothetical protein HDU81_000926 [Chytriomyces hyalinus]|nr:hypothetical protein HDU81_000926 [Chytriomyces hyalinus]